VASTAAVAASLAMVAVKPHGSNRDIITLLPATFERAFYILLQRDTEQPSKTVSQRLALLTAQTFGFLMLAHYSSIFTAVMTVKSPIPSPKSYQVINLDFTSQLLN